MNENPFRDNPYRPPVILAELADEPKRPWRFAWVVTVFLWLFALAFTVVGVSLLSFLIIYGYI